MITNKKKRKVRGKRKKLIKAALISAGAGAAVGYAVDNRKKIYNKVANAYYRKTGKSRPYNPKLVLTSKNPLTNEPYYARVNNKTRYKAAVDLIEKGKPANNRNINSYIVEQRKSNLKTLGSRKGRTPGELEVIRRKQKTIAKANAEKANDLRKKGAYYKMNNIPLAEF